MIRRYLPRSTQELIHWYERYVSPISLLVGFTLDAVAVQVLDLQTYSFVLLFHLSLAATGILLLHLIDVGRFRHPVLVSGVQFIPVVVQFSFGGLYSGFLILYSQSAALALSWIFVVIIAALLIGNERFRRFYATFPVRVGILFFALFSFTIFYIPIVTKEIGPQMFLASGLISLAVITGYLHVARLLMPALIKDTKTTILKIIATTFLLINALYFVSAIPPIPLALRDAGVFHSVVREGGVYKVSYEPRAWHEFYLRYKQRFHLVPGEAVYVYTAIFAPTGISTTLMHEWQWYDEGAGEWHTKEIVSFPIAGGRDGGYRGYTIKRDVREGYWRVNVETDYGQLIGRVAFVVEEVASPVQVETGER